MSKAIQQIEERMAALSPGSLRYETLQAAKDFKNSWVALGQRLWTVWKDKKFREWGYLTFDAYCAKELGIRSATAKKLLYSYYFLEKEEPTTLRRIVDETPAKLPHLDAVNTLRLLKNRQGVGPLDYQKVRDRILEKGEELALVRPQVQTILESTRPHREDEEEIRQKSLVRRMVTTLKGIQQELKSGDLVPRKLLEQIGKVIHQLEELLR